MRASASGGVRRTLAMRAGASSAFESANSCSTTSPCRTSPKSWRASSATAVTGARKRVAARTAAAWNRIMKKSGRGLAPGPGYCPTRTSLLRIEAQLREAQAAVLVVPEVVVQRRIEDADRVEVAVTVDVGGDR